MPNFDEIRAASPASDMDSIYEPTDSIQEPEPYHSDTPTYIGLDFDGCLSHEAETAPQTSHETPVENLFRQNKSLRDHFKDYRVEKFANASLRQCAYVENHNARISPLSIKSWFQLIKPFSKLMGWTFMPWSVSDFFTPNRMAGDSLNLFLQGSKEQDKCPVDQSKLLIVFGQIQHIANERQASKEDGKFIYAQVDDRKNILEGLYDFLINNPFLIPQQAQIHFFHYQGQDVEKMHVLQGTGEIYEDYPSIMVKMIDTLQKVGFLPFVEPFELTKIISVRTSGSQIELSLKPVPRIFNPILENVFDQSDAPKLQLPQAIRVPPLRLAKSRLSFFEDDHSPDEEKEPEKASNERPLLTFPKVGERSCFYSLTGRGYDHIGPHAATVPKTSAFNMLLPEIGKR